MFTPQGRESKVLFSWLGSRFEFTSQAVSKDIPQIGLAAAAKLALEADSTKLHQSTFSPHTTKENEHNIRKNVIPMDQH